MRESRLFGQGGPIFNQKTYNVIWMGDLEDLICDELGVIKRGEVDPATGERDWDGFQINLAMGEKGQDSYEIVDANEYADCSPEWYIENYGEKSFDYYMKQLFDKGLLPTDYPLFIQVWW
jgi:hypothetical protein